MNPNTSSGGYSTLFRPRNLPVMFAIDMTANDIENDESDDQNQNKYH